MSKERSIQTLSLDGNCICFNFINTVHDRTDENPFEYLSSYQNLIDWCRRLKIMPEERIEMLEIFKDAHPSKAQKILGEIISVREMLYQFFSRIAAGKKVKESELEKFNAELSCAFTKLGFVSEGALVQLDWIQDSPQLKEPLWRIMKSAYDILTEESFDRIKECEACGWVFLDQSKNKSRRWCSMESCGSIHKAKKYYHRKKKKESKKAK